MAEITVWLGLSVVFILLYARLGFAERSHLFEYIVLAIFLHKALLERVKQGKIIANPGLVAFLLTLAIGTFDELIQIFLPKRIFDPFEIFVNGLSALLAIAGSWTLSWVRKKQAFNNTFRKYSGLSAQEY